MSRDRHEPYEPRTLEAAPYPHAGAVLIVSAHSSGHSVAPAVVGWQVVRLLASGEQCSVGGMHARLGAARTFAQTTFSNIAGWQRLSATVLAARVPELVPHIPAASHAPPRRRANGLRMPLWRP
jgi:hypothetical protein